MKKRTWITLIISLVFVFAFSACQAQPDVEPKEPSSDVDGNFITGEAVYVDQIELLMMESFPLQVSAVVKGNLPDGCTRIVESFSEKRDEKNFEITIITQRPGDLMCTESLVPFEENIAIDVYGLPAGTYAVNAYGQSAEFTFETDNVIPE
jgi:inhibitor of cysteine peptidase